MNQLIKAIWASLAYTLLIEVISQAIVKKKEKLIIPPPHALLHVVFKKGNVSETADEQVHVLRRHLGGRFQRLAHLLTRLKTVAKHTQTLRS